jgi:hypothetical protein
MANSSLFADPNFAFVVRATAQHPSEADARAVTDWSRVLDIALEQRVYPRVALHASTLFPPEHRDELRVHAQENARAALHNIARTSEAVGLLASRGVESIVLKGPLLSRFLYGDVARRVAGDIDLLVQEKDLLRACEALASHGYGHDLPINAKSLARHRRREHDVAFFDPVGGTRIELHADIAQPHYGIGFDLSDWWTARRKEAVGRTEVWVLGPEHGYLLTAVHAAKHRWECLDLVADLAGYRKIALDWARIYAEAAKAWQLRAVRTGETLASGLLVSDTPLHGTAAIAARKIAAAQGYSRKEGALFDLDLRERTRDRVHYLWRRFLSAKLKL